MTERQFNQGAVIFREKDSGDSLFLIKDGSVGVYSGYGSDSEEKIAELKAGEYFGEMGLLEGYPRSATVVALSEVNAEEVSAYEIIDYFKEKPETLVSIMEQLSQRIRSTTEDYKEVSKTISMVQTEGKKESLMGRLKKYASVYRSRKAIADGLSAEAKRNLDEGSHSEGSKGKVENYKRGTIIFKEGETGTCLYDLHMGTVGIFVGYGTPQEKKVVELLPNHFFGEMGMIEKLPRTATAVALEDNTYVEMFYEEDLLKVYKENPRKLEMIMNHFCNRLRRITSEYLEACRIAAQVAESGEEAAKDYKPSTIIAAM